MRFAVTCLVAAAVAASPCAYDTDPRETSPIATAIIDLIQPNAPAGPAAVDLQPTGRVPATGP